MQAELKEQERALQSLLEKRTDDMTAKFEEHRSTLQELRHVSDSTDTRPLGVVLRCIRCFIFFSCDCGSDFRWGLGRI